MSVELVLLPVAMAGFSAAVAGFSALRAMLDRGDGEEREVCVVQTRMKDPALLAAAFANLGAEAKVTAGGEVEANWDSIDISFARNEEGILTAHFDGDVDVARAQDLALAIDGEYARLVQEAVRDRVLARAADLGMTVESETVDADAGITLVLNVEA